MSRSDTARSDSDELVTHGLDALLSEVFLQLLQTRGRTDLEEALGHLVSREVSPQAEQVEEVSEVSALARRKPPGDGVRANDRKAVVDPLHPRRSLRRALVVQHGAV